MPGDGGAMVYYGDVGGLLYRDSYGYHYTEATYFPLRRAGYIGDSRKINGVQYEVYPELQWLGRLEGLEQYNLAPRIDPLSFSPTGLVQIGNYPLALYQEISEFFVITHSLQLARVRTDGFVEELMLPVPDSETNPVVVFQLFMLMFMGAREFRTETDTFLLGMAEDLATLRLSLDPLSFHVPKLPAKSGAFPYVFTGD